MRITFVLAQSDLSGGVRIVAEYARRLGDKGHQVVVVSRPPRRPTARETLRSMIKRRPLPSECRRGPSHLDGGEIDYRVIDGHRLVTADDVPDADVVIATWWETAEWVSGYPRSKGVKVYFIQHGGVPTDRIDATWRLPMHKIVIAKWLGDRSATEFGDADYSLVPNGIDLQQFTASPRDKQSVPTVGLVYSHVPIKGCDISLKAFELAARKAPSLKLVAFGSRTPTPDLPLPPNSRFVHQPPQDSIKGLYAAADAWLFSSRSEGFGLPILEAMACRTPVIATPAGAAPELLAGGGGILVPPEDPTALAMAIERMCRLSSPAWRDISDKAFETATRHNWEQSTRLFEDALRRAIAKSGLPSADEHALV